jgi:hypothetical protein
MFGVCVCLFCVYVVLCLGSGLATGLSLVQGVLPSVNDHETEKSEASESAPGNTVPLLAAVFLTRKPEAFTRLQASHPRI